MFKASFKSIKSKQSYEIDLQLKKNLTSSISYQYFSLNYLDSISTYPSFVRNQILKLPLKDKNIM